MRHQRLICATRDLTCVMRVLTSCARFNIVETDELLFITLQHLLSYLQISLDISLLKRHVSLWLSFLTHAHMCSSYILHTRPNFLHISLDISLLKTHVSLWLSSFDTCTYALMIRRSYTTQFSSYLFDISLDTSVLKKHVSLWLSSFDTCTYARMIRRSYAT